MEAPASSTCRARSVQQLLLTSWCTSPKAQEVREAVGQVQCAFSDIRASLATLQQGRQARSQAALAERPRGERQAGSPVRRQPPQPCAPSGPRSPAGWPAQPSTRAMSQPGQCDTVGQPAPRDQEWPAGGSDMPQARSLWPLALSAARPLAQHPGPPSSTTHCRRRAGAAEQPDSSAQSRCAGQAGSQQHPARQRPRKQQHRWHWRAEAAALQVRPPLR